MFGVLGAEEKLRGPIKMPEMSSRDYQKKRSMEEEVVNRVPQ
jgi:hypothetical protein